MKVAVIIDGPNVYGFYNHLNGLKINWQAFLKHIRGPERNLNILKLFYDHRPNDRNGNSFIRYMEEIGFECIGVPLKTYVPHVNNDKVFKSRTDQKLTIEVMKHLIDNDFDRLILVSGDSDYEFLIKECRDARKKVEVWATQTSLSNELKTQADEYHLFDDKNLKHLLVKNGRTHLSARSA